MSKLDKVVRNIVKNLGLFKLKDIALVYSNIELKTWGDSVTVKLNGEYVCEIHDTKSFIAIELHRVRCLKEHSNSLLDDINEKLTKGK